ncbi:transglycosylase SLT domain-containing protein [Aliarcobacter butzleri]|uniref:transglycosylase SLT domain-containing protein n=1 Tax=Aliarcobacter butzleri TaxID=28197 RepID=UPI002876BDAC|nr:transglycosylase SLT domain-containing protein [Aliarcobacter butzleri]MDS1371019.1 transglycosylase SLT domain-containing protein [Aliarcobacter butzleri]
MKLISPGEAIKIGLNEYLEYYKKAVQEFWQFEKSINNIPIEHYFIAQAVQESRFNPNAKSPVGALGIAQFMPNTAKEVGQELKGHQLFKNGFDSLNDIQSVYAQVYYMNKLFRSWKVERTALEKFELALASYNAGLGNILKAQKLSGNKRKWDDIKKYLASVTGRNSLETINYVDLIKIFSVQIEQ